MTCSCYIIILVVGTSYCMLACIAGLYKGWGEVGWECRGEGGVGFRAGGGSMVNVYVMLCLCEVSVV
jgi:hypothetical protein